MSGHATRAAFARQAWACREMGSPFTATLLDHLAHSLTRRTAVGRRLLDWPDPPPGVELLLPLRLAAGLHALALSGADADLAAAWPPARFDAARIAPLVSRALVDHRAALMSWLDGPPQTNEVRRSAMLIPAALDLTARFGLPLVLSELGASAGLNLLFDHHALRIGDARFGPADAPVVLSPDWSGPLPRQSRLQVAERAGVDLNPLDPEADRLRLLSYIWADQAERLARTSAALDLAARLRPPVARGDAADWAEARLAQPRPGHLHLIFHTVAWQYFPHESRARITAALARAGAQASPSAPLAHLSVEAEGQTPDTAITLTLWPGGERRTLGRADFHGRWVRWTG